MKRVILLLNILFLAATAAKEVRLYTERHYDSDKRIFKQFTEQTGIEVKVVKAGADELIARMEAEKDAPQADLYITVDAATLGRASAKGLFQAHDSQTVEDRILDGLAAADGTWVPLTMRARVFATSKERLESPPTSYAGLAEPGYRGRVLVRSSTSHYNQSLLAAIIAASGRDAAMKWAGGVKNNMARPPQGGDRDQIRAVALGLGDIAVTNSYYLGLLEKSDDPKDRAARAAVNVVFPDLDGRGTHVNISGGGIIKGAPNLENAVKLLEFLTSDEIQGLYQELNAEYAVVKGVEPTAIQKGWGEFTPDFESLDELSSHTVDAVRIFNLVGWP
ncbi:extracellular solute-binding protein [Haloferula sp. A504]|uniref:extracellular solute-binding protein n=1 Tax=Haloferula sp. A504 TaxID=3373601 RepID=UPI0031C424A6|nr:extracellular solute-binding protein [Verrucomicrobiaceae bacterium E54]